MSLMKKDMGGAANCIGLAKLISDFNLNADLHYYYVLLRIQYQKNQLGPLIL